MMATALAGNVVKILSARTCNASGAGAASAAEMPVERTTKTAAAAHHKRPGMLETLREIRADFGEAGSPYSFSAITYTHSGVQRNAASGSIESSRSRCSVKRARTVSGAAIRRRPYGPIVVTQPKKLLRGHSYVERAAHERS